MRLLKLKRTPAPTKMESQEHQDLHDDSRGRVGGVIFTVIGAIVATIVATVIADFIAMGIALAQSDNGRHVVAPQHSSSLVGYLALGAPLIVLTIGGGASLLARRWSFWIASCWLAGLALSAPFVLLATS